MSLFCSQVKPFFHFFSFILFLSYKACAKVTSICADHAGMQLMIKGTSLDTVQESEVAEAAGSETDEESYAPSLQPAASETLAEFPDWKKDSKDCVDPSANFWDTLAGLRSSAHNHSIGHGLDFIAP